MIVDIDTELISWLNKRTEQSSHNVIFVDSFVFMLVKIKKQGYVRLTEDGQFHKRFWKAFDNANNYHLFHPKKKKQNEVPLFQFFYQLAVKEDLIKVENLQGKITSKGVEFLNQSNSEQLAFLLNTIWND